MKKAMSFGAAGEDEIEDFAPEVETGSELSVHESTVSGDVEDCDAVDESSLEEKRTSVRFDSVVGKLDDEIDEYDESFGGAVEDNTDSSENTTEATNNDEILESVEKSLERDNLLNRISCLISDFDEHPVKSLKRLSLKIAPFVTDAITKHGLKKIVRNGVIVESDNFEFVKSGNRIIVMKYKGASTNLRIPSAVGGLPVTMLHPDFLTAGVFSGGILHSYSMNALRSVYRGESVESLAGFDLGSVVSGVTSIELPESLTGIMKGTFSKCKGIEKLVVPESVVAVQNNAFIGGSITDLYFNGEVPKGFNVDEFNGRVFRKVV